MSVRGGSLAPSRLAVEASRWGGLCKRDGCDRRARAKGYCQTHYYQERRTGGTFDILSPGRERPPCSEDGCDAAVMARDWCASHYRLNWGRHAKYGLTAEGHDRMMKEQKGVCRICREARDKMVIDHDHDCCPGQGSCGECVRGIICDLCNVGLGMFRDNPQRLQGAIDYLRDTKP